MKKRLVSHIAFIDKYLAKKTYDSSYEEILSYHQQQILFMQHERLIHLIVTVLFALISFGCMFTLLITEQLSLILLFFALLILLVPYVFHYYTLENGVQKMYAQYDELLKIKQDFQQKTSDATSVPSNDCNIEGELRRREKSE